MSMRMAVKFVVPADACTDKLNIAVDEEQGKYDVAYTAGQPNREEEYDEHAGSDCDCKFTLEVHEYMC